MATITFALDHEEGHILPTFKLARQLRKRGHSVVYLGLEDSGDFIRRQGFDFLPILQEVFPRGAILRGREELAQPLRARSGSEEDLRRIGRAYETYLAALAQGRGVDGPVARIRPDLFILNNFQELNALVLDARYRVPIVLLSPCLLPASRREGLESLEAILVGLSPETLDAFFALARRHFPGVRKVRDITQRLLGMRQLIQCPQDFALPHESARDPEIFFIEAGVDLERRDDRGFPWERLDRGKKLLYVSLGSQAFLAGRDRALAFLRAVAAGAARRTDWQLVLATGDLCTAADLPLPSDAVALSWIPQIPVLEQAAVMVTHGGLGTVKECIFQGVPMVVFPVGRDQPDNAKRIVHHHLGLQGEIAGATPDAIFSLVEQVDRDPLFRASVRRMGQRFQEVERSGIGVHRIEEVLTTATVNGESTLKLA
jgi:zeaxanthin glucosyltransferase